MTSEELSNWKNDKPIILILCISFGIAISVVFIPYGAIATKTIHNTLVFQFVDHQRLDHFVLTTDANTSIELHANYMSFENGLIAGHNNNGHFYVSQNSGLSFWGCWYEAVPCYFVATWVDDSTITKMIKDAIPIPIKGTISYCDKNNNCADTLDGYRNMMVNGGVQYHEPYVVKVAK